MAASLTLQRDTDNSIPLHRVLISISCWAEQALIKAVDDLSTACTG